MYIQPYALIGHDARVGDYCHINSYAFLGGYASMDSMSTLHTGAKLLPHKHVGEGAVVGAGSVAVRNVRPDTTVFGIPAKELKTPKIKQL